MMEAKRDEISSEFARGLRRIAYATLFLFLCWAITAVVIFAIRARDIEQRVKETAALNARQAETIEYLCETVNVMDLIIVQEARYLKRSSRSLGPNQRQLLRERLATLQAAHFELTDQRACRSFK
jgi:hypothetical protein